MAAHGPAFCDITWGAGGSTADLTLDIANKMQNLICVETMMHLTCTNILVDKIDHAPFPSQKPSTPEERRSDLLANRRRRRRFKEKTARLHHLFQLNN
ncbi:hypothetical protein ACFX10_032919 [Malus domestica]